MATLKEYVCLFVCLFSKEEVANRRVKIEEERVTVLEVRVRCSP